MRMDRISRKEGRRVRRCVCRGRRRRFEEYSDHFPHELERVEEERGEQMAKQEEEEEEEINSNRPSNYRARCKRSTPPHKAPYQHSNLKSSLLKFWSNPKLQHLHHLQNLNTFESGLASLAVLQRQQQQTQLLGGFRNGDVMKGFHRNGRGGLIMPPSPRSLSADSNRPQPRKKRSSSSRAGGRRLEEKIRRWKLSIMEHRARAVLPHHYQTTQAKRHCYSQELDGFGS
jgi:hypothetical protein